MINRLFGAVFTPKYPKGYVGRHRAQLALVRAIAPSYARGTDPSAPREAAD